MSKFVRRSLLVSVIAAVAIPVWAASSSGQEVPVSELTVTVRKTVVGTGTGPSAVTVSCEGNAQQGALAATEYVLNFDAQGNATTATQPVPVWVIEDGAWVSRGGSSAGGSCTFTETAAGGATSTAFTCAYDATEVVVPRAAVVPEGAGCDSPGAAGVGPVTVVYPGEDVVSQQESTVVFTNTFVAAPPVVQAVVVQPTFTG